MIIMKTIQSSAFIHWLSLLFCLILLSGCGTVRLEVPSGHEVRLLEQDDYASVRVERTIWFWLWGARPISDNTTRKEIEEYNLKEVRLQTEQSMTDNITNLLLVWSSIVRRTMTIEGNTETYQKNDQPQTSAGAQQ